MEQVHLQFPSVLVLRKRAWSGSGGGERAVCSGHQGNKRGRHAPGLRGGGAVGGERLGKNNEKKVE